MINFRSMASTLILSSMFLSANFVMAQDSSTFLKVESHQSYTGTISALKKAINSNQMMVMGHIDQAKVLSMTGLQLDGAETFFVGNPQMGKKAFGMDPAAGAVLPARLYVWSAQGHTFIGYFQPSSQLMAVSPSLAQVGEMLDKKLNMVASQAAM